MEVSANNNKDIVIVKNIIIQFPELHIMLGCRYFNDKHLLLGLSHYISKISIRNRYPSYLVISHAFHSILTHIRAVINTEKCLPSSVCVIFHIAISLSDQTDLLLL